MSELIINQTYDECRVALICDGEVSDFLIDTGEEKSVIGNIYKGRVSRILPGMQAAFVDIGLDRSGFLYADDAHIPTIEEQRNAMNIHQHYLGELNPDELSDFSDMLNSIEYTKPKKIENILKEGDLVMVQVAKGPISTKGARVTRHITIAGRYIVFTPLMEILGVSKRIESESERARLLDILKSICPEGKGVIARTNAKGQSYRILKQEFNQLVKYWKSVVDKFDKIKASRLVSNDISFVERVLRDLTDDDIEKIVVDTKENFRIVNKFVNKYLLKIKGNVVLHNGNPPLFEHYNLEKELTKVIASKIFLKSGGHINIDQTEALVSIDVNTGKFVGKQTLADTIFQTNLEAVREIAYQIKLRNCGGIIIIDFIDMVNEEHREKIYQALLDVLKKDRAKTNVMPISGLGLVEMTRKRKSDTLVRILCNTCPYCEGTGKVKTVTYISYQIIRDLIKNISKKDGDINLYVHPDVATKLGQLKIIDKMERDFNKNLSISSESAFHIEHYELH